MELGIPETFGFADYESRGRRDSETDLQFDCIINLLLILLRPASVCTRTFAPNIYFVN